jgi:hypothetical protein
MSDYITMTEIGEVLGLTSHQVGKRLKKLGLRTPEGRPSQAAFTSKLVAQKWTRDGQHYLWAWAAEEIVTLLAGNTEVVQDHLNETRHP